MPESAINSGSVDYVLNPAGIARELERISGHSTLKRVEPPDELPGTDSELAEVFALLRSVTSVDFSCYKPTTLRRRIVRRMVLKKIERLGDYLKLLQSSRAEAELLFQDVLINVTG